MTRNAALRDFVETTDWVGATLSPLAGDASNRRYLRLRSQAGHAAVLMDAPPEKGEDVAPFLKIAAWLSTQGLGAPRVYAADADHGFLLLEDLGDDLFARVLSKDAALEPQLYEAAIDVLLAVAQVPLPNVPAYGSATMAKLAGLAGHWYAGSDGLAEALEGAVFQALSALEDAPPTLALRDYHAENLLWLPGRQGLARVGLLDFQDARIGHAAYDLASLLRDARRDPSPTLFDPLIARMAQGLGQPVAEFSAAMATQGAQRNLRILGGFARLSLHFGKPHYVDLIPRVYRNLEAELSHPHLAPLRAVARALPTPTPAHLKTLKDRCGTIPTLA
ncbi:MAG: phosphotransferase [Pseudomonadota bacterium]